MMLTRRVDNAPMDAGVDAPIRRLVVQPRAFFPAKILLWWDARNMTPTVAIYEDRIVFPRKTK